ncbi:MAG: HD domain-containing protein [Chloroflexi bacterium]|nr:HD domain-containing protein [Chloroflexota bacterium]
MDNPPQLLLIDHDVHFLHDLAESISRQGVYQVVTADNGPLGIKLAEENLPDLIVCELFMPAPDGLEVLRSLSENFTTIAIPFIFIANNVDEQKRTKCMELGADDFILKPFVRDELLRQVRVLLRRKEITEAHERLRSVDEISVLGAKVRELLHSLRTDHTGLAEALTQMLSLRDAETAEHSHRVVMLSDKVARRLGLEGRSLHHIRLGALVHDIGKVGIPDAILLKEGSQTDEERAIMQTHTALGRKIIEHMELPQAVVDLVYHHHERWDGSGYPDGLAGENIPLSARIFGIVDVWDALTSERPYRKALSEDKVIVHLLDQAGKHFDPMITKVFLEVIQNDVEWNNLQFPQG